MKDALAAKDASFAESFAFERARLNQLEAKVTQLETLELIVQQQKKIATLQQNDERLSNSPPSQSIAPQFAIHPTSSVDSNDKTAVAAAAMPKSCADLRYFGHAASGLYLIMGTDKVETVYCDFTALPSDPSKIILCELQFN